jgi:hypothetical protein
MPPSMIIFKIAPVIPNDLVWFAMLVLIGVLGLIGQVCTSMTSFSSADPYTPQF